MQTDVSSYNSMRLFSSDSPSSLSMNWRIRLIWRS